MPGGSTIERASTRLWHLLLAVLTLIAVLVGSAGRAVQAAPPMVEGTWAGHWDALAAVDGAQASLVGLHRAKGGSGLVLDAGALSGDYVSAAHDMGHEYMAVGVSWVAQLPTGTSLAVEVRQSLDGVAWESWHQLVPEDAGPDVAPKGPIFSELVFGQGRYLQVRATLSGGSSTPAPGLETLKVIAIDARPGPQPTMGEPAAPPLGTAEGLSALPIISRAGWGANESWMTWAPQYAPVTHFVIHHTDTSNSSADSDPAAVIRSIYYYHAITRGWGDIGYNILIDRQGRIYEGRYGGPNAIGGHAAPYNSGTIGVAILGTYSTASVPDPALSWLETFIAWKCSAYGIDPLGSSWLRDRTFSDVMGHRDCNNTTCPGDRAYALLPQIRSGAAALMGPLSINLAQPAANAALSGVSPVSWQLSGLASQLAVSVDGQVRQSLPPSATSWDWNTTLEGEGPHSLRVTASTASGQSSYAEVPVRVDNVPPTGTLAAPAFANSAPITLTLSCQGCTQMQFGAGWRWEGEDLSHEEGTGSVVSDPAAANGRAWLGTVAGSQWGAWYGPYFCGLPYPGDYEADFWLRCGQIDVSADVALLDVSDGQATRMLGGPLGVAGTGFASTARYQPFRMAFRYPDRGISCQGTAQDGLELRTWFQDTADLWLDRVEIFTVPQPFNPTWRYQLPQAEGRYPVEVRFADAAGNLSPVYMRTVTVDHTPPAWGKPTPQGLPVGDALAGLDAAGAVYALSTDGVTWGDWTPTELSLEAGATRGLLPAEPSWAGQYVRARVHDRSGNVATSPTADWQADPVWDFKAVYLPLVIN